ncbi:MAG: Rieske 2Fe-2S domain-containing protein [Proteobacteria bacterium]|nr:Rieske 2Fe-2S domain-containing protein [Pseudomonadota bacterium]
MREDALLSKANNELLTRVGSGTPMGELLRRFWVPGFLEDEVSEPDSPPIKLRLFGEDLVAFKDTDGRIGVIDNHCAHRQASLYFGRNEECGLRCVYHGWKFDVEGNCIDMPSEPNPSKTLMAKAKLKSYPAVARGGVVWLYMGPPEKEPQLPEFEWSRLPAVHRTATKRLQECNWAQAVEGGIDSSHISFLHGSTDKQLENRKKSGSNVPGNKFHALDRHPVFDVKEADHGLLISARRNAGDAQYYWRITQFLVPFYQMIPPVGNFENSGKSGYSGHAWVPIDDENTWTWTFHANPHQELTDEQREFHGGRTGMWGPTDENYRPVQNRDNNYRLDREAQRNDNFTGIQGIPNQDAAVQESMGPIVDRTKELLGHSDSAVIKFRQMMIGMAKDLNAGKEPIAARHGDWYNVRSASVVLDRELEWQESAAWLLRGDPLQKAAE